MSKVPNIGEYDPSGAENGAADLLRKATEELRCFRGDPVATVDSALKLAPRLVMAHALRAYLYLLSSEAGGAAVARESLTSATALAQNEREALHLKAIDLWCNGRWRAAARTLEDLSIHFPLDSLALQVGHQLDFFTGDARLLRDRIARALPAWSESMPGWHALLGMHAFGLEENGDYAEAERLGRRAVELEPGDAWAQHAVVHVLEMQGRRDEGVAWMRGQQGWRQGNLLAVHNWWHLALHQLAQGDQVGVLDLYDGPIHGHRPEIHLELVDASALLWRLHLLGCEVGSRWAALAERWAANAKLSYYAFNDWHAIIAFVGAGRDDLVQTMVQAQSAALERADDNAAFTREVGFAAGQAIVAFGQQDWRRCVNLLRSVRSQSHRFGGSLAQRDLIDLTLIEAARRSGDMALHRAFEDERNASAQGREARTSAPVR